MSLILASHDAQAPIPAMGVGAILDDSPRPADTSTNVSPADITRFKIGIDEPTRDRIPRRTSLPRCAVLTSRNRGNVVRDDVTRIGVLCLNRQRRRAGAGNGVSSRLSSGILQGRRQIRARPGNPDSASSDLYAITQPRKYDVGLRRVPGPIRGLVELNARSA